MQTIQKGLIRTRVGRVLGEHVGFHHYTRGQRRGLGVAHTERLYVLETLPETNEVVVGTREEVLGLEAVVGRVHWILKPDFSQEVRARVKIRSQHVKAPALLNLLADGRVAVEFDEAQDAITPGQAAVFYDGRPATDAWAGWRILGGGWIDEAR
jgi:tRNA-specific 2-thiouridylase